MKIIKKGVIIKNKKVKTFICPECGCIFEATEDEYQIKEEETYGGYIGTYYIINCPYCFKHLVL